MLHKSKVLFCGWNLVCAVVSLTHELGVYAVEGPGAGTTTLLHWKYAGFGKFFDVSLPSLQTRRSSRSLSLARCFLLVNPKWRRVNCDDWLTKLAKTYRFSYKLCKTLSTGTTYRKSLLVLITKLIFQYAVMITAQIVTRVVLASSRRYSANASEVA